MNKTNLIILKNKTKFILGFGKKQSIIFNSWIDFDRINDFLKENSNQLIFTTLSYEIKNFIEKLSSNNRNILEFPIATFWTSELVLETDFTNFKILEGNMTLEFENRYKQVIASFLNPKKASKTYFQARTQKKNYLKNIEKIKNEIQQGNVYELNYCQEFYAESVENLDGLSLFFEVDKLTKAPFSCYVDNGVQQLICGSPERFLRKNGNKIISQPIKGTIQRGRNETEDTHFKNKLKSDPKELSENVMITDLVRNDLSKIAKKNTVNVEELCGLYSFGTVHQLISTISCNIKEECKFTDILKALFPMGSMTGAPKISAMNLIEKYEDFNRGIYSGSVGYISPNGNFDLNVVIRSFVYHSEKKYLSCSVGGAITIQSDAEKEYEECLTKVLRLLKLFGDDQLQ